MFYETILEINDRSYYTDRLEQLTGRRRSMWFGFSLALLRRRLERELKDKEASARREVL